VEDIKITYLRWGKWHMITFAQCSQPMRWGETTTPLALRVHETRALEVNDAGYISRLGSDSAERGVAVSCRKVLFWLHIVHIWPSLLKRHHYRWPCRWPCCWSYQPRYRRPHRLYSCCWIGSFFLSSDKSIPLWYEELFALLNTRSHSFDIAG